MNICTVVVFFNFLFIRIETNKYQVIQTKANVLWVHCSFVYFTSYIYVSQEVNTINIFVLKWIWLCETRLSHVLAGILKAHIYLWLVFQCYEQSKIKTSSSYLLNFVDLNAKKKYETNVSEIYKVKKRLTFDVRVLVSYLITVFK